MQSVSKKLDSQFDIEEYVLPAMDSIGGLLRNKYIDAEMKDKLEGLTMVYNNICATISRLYEANPSVLACIRKYYEKIASTEIVTNIIETIFLGANSPSFSILTPNTWQNLMMSLKYACQFCPSVCLQCISSGLLTVLQKIMTADLDTVQTSNMEKAKEAIILLLDSILPQKHLIIYTKKEKEQNKERIAIETEKEEIVHGQDNAIQILGEGVLARLIRIFEEGTSASTKFACMQTIEKLCYLCDTPVLVKTISPQTAARLMISNLSDTDNLFACLGLRFFEVVLQKLATDQPLYVSQAKREGIFEKIKQFLNVAGLLKRFEEDKPRPWLQTENTYLKFILSQARTLHKKWLTQQKKGKIMGLEEHAGAALLNAGFDLKLGQHFQMQKRWSQGLFSRYLNYFLYLKSEQLCKLYLDNEDYLKQCPSLQEAELSLSLCSKLAENIAALLAKGVQGNVEDWKKNFTQLAEILASDASITNYEAVASKVITRVYESLCISPSSYGHALAPAKEELKQSSGPDKAELQQMEIRHTVFMDAFLSQAHNRMQNNANQIGNPMKELIRKIHELVNEVEVYKVERKEMEISSESILKSKCVIRLTCHSTIKKGRTNKSEHVVYAGIIY